MCLAARSDYERRCLSQTLQLAVILLVGLCVLNCGYGFEGSGQKLGDYQFMSSALGGPTDRPASHGGEGRNRFAGTGPG